MINVNAVPLLTIQKQKIMIYYLKKKNNNCTIVFVILHKIPQGFRYFFADFYMHYYFLPCYILKEKNLYKSNHISPSIICKLL